MSFDELFTGVWLVLDGLTNHPKTTLLALVGGTAITLGAINYDAWRTPARAQKLYEQASVSPVDFNYKCRYSRLFGQKTGHGRVSVESDKIILEYDMRDKQKGWLNSHPRTESLVIIDKVPYGSPDWTGARTRYQDSGQVVNNSWKQVQGSEDEKLTKSNYRKMVKQAVKK